MGFAAPVALGANRLNDRVADVGGVERRERQGQGTSRFEQPPRFIKDEFDALPTCAIPAHGLLRLRCGECGHDTLLALGCKRRGFCPSCGARRMSQTAEHRVHHVIPRVPVRQWAPSLPIPLRLVLAAQPELVTPVLGVVQRVLERRLRDATGVVGAEGQGGAVTPIQRFGSAANLDIHLHCLVLDGVCRCDADGLPDFIDANAPTDDAMQTLLQTVLARLMKMLTRRGALVEDVGRSWLVEPAGEGDEARTLAAAEAAPDPVPRGAGAQRQAAAAGGARGARGDGPATEAAAGVSSTQTALAHLVFPGVERSFAG